MRMTVVTRSNQADCVKSPIPKSHLLSSDHLRIDSLWANPEQTDGKLPTHDKYWPQWVEHILHVLVEPTSPISR